MKQLFVSLCSSTLEFPTLFTFLEIIHCYYFVNIHKNNNMMQFDYFSWVEGLFSHSRKIFSLQYKTKVATWRENDAEYSSERANPNSG